MPSSKTRPTGFSLKRSLRQFLAETETIDDNSDKRNNNRCIDILKWIGVILILPPILNFASLQREKTELFPDITLFDVGFGQRMFMNCTGSGTPTVILDAPTGHASDIWTLVMKELGKSTKVCVFDRAGLGRSDLPKHFNTSDPGEAAVAKLTGPVSTTLRMVHDLYRLVTHSNPQEFPLILVGSELGAVNSLAYSLIHSEQVAGTVLIDPLTSSLFEESTTNSWSKYHYGSLLPHQRLLEIGALTGINRLAILTKMLKPYSEDFDIQAVLREKHWLCNSHHLNSAYLEYSRLPASADQLEHLLRVSSSSSSSKTINKDTIVMTGNYYDELYPSFLNHAWSKSAQELISRIKGCQQSVINGADKNMIYKSSQEVVAPVLRIVKKWRRTNVKQKPKNTFTK